eukprot:444877-Hanusia_phi.AAC.2
MKTCQEEEDNKSEEGREQVNGRVIEYLIWTRAKKEKGNSDACQRRSLFLTVDHPEIHETSQLLQLDVSSKHASGVVKSASSPRPC